MNFERLLCPSHLFNSLASFSLRLLTISCRASLHLQEKKKPKFASEKLVLDQILAQYTHCCSGRRITVHSDCDWDCVKILIVKRNTKAKQPKLCIFSILWETGEQVSIESVKDWRLSKAKWKVFSSRYLKHLLYLVLFRFGGFLNFIFKLLCLKNKLNKEH